ncbi:MAG TPA: ferrous iron transporter B [Pseudomonadales bacterium]|nr:ferrous iron transporter B [Pseudomonadales bacterium]
MKPARPFRFALVGNPNCGKTSLFNRLTGAKAKVANYAGVTVEKRSGELPGFSNTELIDLPGTYSFFVTSPDERITRDLILGHMSDEAPPDVLIAVVDATRLRLGLRLVLELKALNRPMILALNQADAAKQQGISIQLDKLAAHLNMPVVETVAIRQEGVVSLLAEMRSTQARVSQQAAPVLSFTEREQSVEELYAHIEKILADCVSETKQLQPWQDRIDRLVMHPVLGLFILLTTLLLMFQAVFAWATPVTDLIDNGVQALGAFAAARLPAGILNDFIVNGFIAGTGSVLVFLPQIIILFAFILVLEDSGYLPRAAFLLDRLMLNVGLSGRSFIPLLSSFACAVPGIMATRTIQDPRERLITILVAPLMTCSARLPVYALIIGAFIPNKSVWGIFNLQGLTLFALYIAGIISAICIAWLLKKRQNTEIFPLLLELPVYRWPNLPQLLIGLKERVLIFLRRVGTIILSLSIILWFLATFPAAPLDASRPAIEYSFAGMLGHFMLPVFAPLGFNWQMCIALIPAMAAREVAVSALATVYAVAASSVDVTADLNPVLGQSWSLATALAYLAWFVYAPQCLSTIAVVKQESNSWKTTAGFIAYLFALAYLAALLTYRLALLFLNP